MKYPKIKHYLIYQITNLINNKIYIGKHCTEDINDNYMGSGTLIRKAIKKYSNKNFKKEILFTFDNEECMDSKEREIINEEFVNRKDTYNLTLGGNGSWHHFKDTVSVIDENNQTFRISKNDKRYIAGELKPVTKGFVPVKDKQGKIFLVEKNDERYISGELKYVHTGKTIVKDKNGNTFSVSVKDPKFLSGEYISITSGTVSVKDKNGKTMRVSMNDPRYLAGDLVSTNLGRIRIVNWKIKENKIVPAEELDRYLKEGWVKGRGVNFQNFDDNGNKLPDYRFIEYWREYINGASITEISKKYSLSYSTLKGKFRTFRQYYKDKNKDG
jgi:hypothetical protein